MLVCRTPVFPVTAFIYSRFCDSSHELQARDVNKKGFTTILPLLSLLFWALCHASSSNLSMSSSEPSPCSRHCRVCALRISCYQSPEDDWICPWTNCLFEDLYLNLSRGSCPCLLGLQAWVLPNTGSTDHRRTFQRSRSLFKRFSVFFQANVIHVAYKAIRHSLLFFKGYHRILPQHQQFAMRKRLVLLSW